MASIDAPFWTIDGDHPFRNHRYHDAGGHLIGLVSRICDEETGRPLWGYWASWDYRPNPHGVWCLWQSRRFRTLREAKAHLERP